MLNVANVQRRGEEESKKWASECLEVDLLPVERRSSGEGPHQIPCSACDALSQVYRYNKTIFFNKAVAHNRFS